MITVTDCVRHPLQDVEMPAYVPGLRQVAAVQVSGATTYINVYDVTKDAAGEFAISRLTHLTLQLAMVRFASRNSLRLPPAAAMVEHAHTSVLVGCLYLQMVSTSL
jgi:hypothetical protein